MRDAIVVLKNGKTVEGPLWTWRPKEGWFELAAMHDEDIAAIANKKDPGRILLREVVSAVNPQQRINIHEIRDVDLLERARNEGWDGT
jgi:hypothetical protein